MNEGDKSRFHNLYGVRKERIFFKNTDFIDYEIMIAITAAIVFLVYGVEGPVSYLSYIGGALCLWMAISYPIRNGAKLAMPIILKRPQDVLFSILYRFNDQRLEYYCAVAMLVAQHFLIQATPGWPHYTEFMRNAAIWLLYIHLGLTTLYRTISLVDHLRKIDRVEEVLKQTVWKRLFKGPLSATYEIWHAYFTGILTNIVFVAPWYLVIHFVDFSAVLSPIMIVFSGWVFKRFLTSYATWYYREHWVGHNTEYDFVYMHGSHHDAIPIGMIGVLGNGFLEGFFRHTIGGQAQFLHPLATFLVYTVGVKDDIDRHQYVPGIFPKLDKEYLKVHQHSIHHLGKMKPLSAGINLDQGGIPERILKKFAPFPDVVKKTAEMESDLNGFKWDNSLYRWYMDLLEKYDMNDKKPN